MEAIITTIIATIIAKRYDAPRQKATWGLSDYRCSLHGNPSIGREAFARRACGRYGRPYGDGISRSGRKAEESEAAQGGGGPGTSSWPFNVYLFSLKSFTHVSTTSGS